MWCTVLLVTANTATTAPRKATNDTPTTAIPTFELTWNAEAVADLCFRNGIRSRGQLARRIDLGRSTIYDSFSKHWEGTATAPVLAQMAGVFGVPLGFLVCEPGRKRRTAANRRVNRTVTKLAG